MLGVIYTDLTMRNSVKEEQGVTLIETVVYLALFGLIFLSTMNFVLTVSENNRKAESRMYTQRGILFVQEHMTETVRSAWIINEENSVFDSDNGVLALNTVDGVTSYQIVSGRLHYNCNGRSVPVTNVRVVVSRLYFERILDPSDNVVGVRVTMDVESTKGDSGETMITSCML